MQEVTGSSPVPPTTEQREKLLPQDENRPKVCPTGQRKAYNNAYTALALLALSCGIAGPEHAARYDPPAQYPERWVEVEQCVGVHGDMARIRWYRVQGAPFDCPYYRDGCYGEWIAEHDIYLAAPDSKL